MTVNTADPSAGVSLAVPVLLPVGAAGRLSHNGCLQARRRRFRGRNEWPQFGSTIPV